MSNKKQGQKQNQILVLMALLKMSLGKNLKLLIKKKKKKLNKQNKKKKKVLNKQNKSKEKKEKE